MAWLKLPLVLLFALSIFVDSGRSFPSRGRREAEFEETTGTGGGSSSNNGAEPIPDDSIVEPEINGNEFSKQTSQDPVNSVPDNQGAESEAHSTGDEETPKETENRHKSESNSDPSKQDVGNSKKGNVNAAEQEGKGGNREETESRQDDSEEQNGAFPKHENSDLDDENDDEPKHKHASEDGNGASMKQKEGDVNRGPTKQEKGESGNENGGSVKQIGDAIASTTREPAEHEDENGQHAKQDRGDFVGEKWFTSKQGGDNLNKNDSQTQKADNTVTDKTKPIDDNNEPAENGDYADMQPTEEGEGEDTVFDAGEKEGLMNSTPGTVTPAPNIDASARKLATRSTVPQQHTSINNNKSDVEATSTENLLYSTSATLPSLDGTRTSIQPSAPEELNATQTVLDLETTHIVPTETQNGSRSNEQPLATYQPLDTFQNSTPSEAAEPETSTAAETTSTLELEILELTTHSTNLPSFSAAESSMASPTKKQTSPSATSPELSTAKVKQPSTTIQNEVLTSSEVPHNRKRPPVQPGRESGVPNNYLEPTDGNMVTAQKTAVNTKKTDAEFTAVDKTVKKSNENLITRFKTYSGQLVRRYGALKVSLVLLILICVAFLMLFCCCKLCRRKGYKMRQRRLKEFGQEKEFLLSDRSSQRNQYSNDTVTLLEGTSEDEF